MVTDAGRVMMNVRVMLLPFESCNANAICIVDWRVIIPINASYACVSLRSGLKLFVDKYLY